MGESRHGHRCSFRGRHRTGPRESVRYGYRGTIVGEAARPGPTPPPVDLAGAPAPGEVLRYMRPIAQAGPGTSRGGGHRQSKGGKARGAGRRGRSSVGPRALGPMAPDAAPPQGEDGDGTGGALSRSGNATPPDSAVGFPPAFAHATVGGAPSLGVAVGPFEPDGGSGGPLVGAMSPRMRPMAFLGSSLMMGLTPGSVLGPKTNRFWPTGRAMPIDRWRPRPVRPLWDAPGVHADGGAVDLFPGPAGGRPHV